VRLWEKNGSLGRKLLATGNGRCNFTNRSLNPENYHGGGAELAWGIINAFGRDDSIDYFHDLGLSSYADASGRYFPRSNEAASVLFCLGQEMERLGVKVNLRAEIVDISRIPNGWEIRQRGAVHLSDAMILACGGTASPQFGSNGHGYQMAAKLNHALIEPTPSLVPLILEGNWFHKLQGMRMDLSLTAKRGEEPVFEITDEGLFTHYGLSGPLALKSSRALSDRESDCHVNFLPYLDGAEVMAILKDRRKKLGSRISRDFLTGLLPERLGQVMVQQSWLDLDLPCSRISNLQMERLQKNLCSWKVVVKGLRPFKEAQVTAGGIDCRQVFPGSLMSKKAPGLFFCGEVLDVDGDTGGYNLQWCWSSGYAAGKAAAEYVKRG